LIFNKLNVKLGAKVQIIKIYIPFLLLRNHQMKEIERKVFCGKFDFLLEKGFILCKGENLLPLSDYTS